MSTTKKSTIPMPTKANSAPEWTSVYRIASIPLISSGLNLVDDTLVSYTLTRSPYCTIKDISVYLLKSTEPIQIRIAPLIEGADKYANKAIDTAESHFPSVFKTNPDDITTYVRDRKQNASEYYEDKVKTPAVSAVVNIDRRFTPWLDLVEKKFNAGPSSADSKYQYQRALAISKSLPVSLYGYTNEQVKQLQAQNLYAQRATEAARSISELATSSVSTFNTRIHSYSEAMMTNITKLQDSTSTFSTSQLQPQLQRVYADISASLLVTKDEVTKIMNQDAPIQEKIVKLNGKITEQISPLLEAIKGMALDALGKGRAVVSQTNEVAESKVNGLNAH